MGLERLRAKILGVDGYNVIITVESALRHQTVFLCRDGLWRDIAGSCRGPSCPPLISTIISLIMQVLKKAGPKRVDIFLDSPISGSRNLARTLKKRLSEEGLAGQAQEVLSPEKQLLDYPVVVTSDSGLIDRAGAVFDLAGYILKKCLKIPLHPF